MTTARASSAEPNEGEEFFFLVTVGTSEPKLILHSHSGYIFIKPSSETEEVLRAVSGEASKQAREEHGLDEGTKFFVFNFSIMPKYLAPTEEAK